MYKTTRMVPLDLSMPTVPKDDYYWASPTVQLIQALRSPDVTVVVWFDYIQDITTIHNTLFSTVKWSRV